MRPKALSGFDGIFLFKPIILLKKLGYDINFLKRDEKFINIPEIYPLYKNRGLRLPALACYVAKQQLGLMAVRNPCP
jgi:hypothetical protein